MKWLSDKFKIGRHKPEAPSQYKHSITFNRYIKQLDDKLEKDNKLDIVADFDYYDIHCDQCLTNNSKVSSMYIVQTEELMIRLARGELIEADSSDLLVTCPLCGNMQKIVDLRQQTGLVLPAGLLPEEIGKTGNIISKHRDRNISYTDNLPEESKAKYEALLLMSKRNDTTNVNKTKAKELENYVKQYNAVRSTYKDKSFVRDIDALDTAGLSVVKVEDIEY